MTRRFVVTGATGFIGLNVLECLLGAGDVVTAVAMDDIPALARHGFASLPGRLMTTRADVRDRATMEALVREAAPDAIIAAAAITSGPERERTSPADILEVNLVATLRLLEVAARHNVARVIGFSSSAAMGELPFLGHPVTEAHRPEPVSYYGISKAAIEASAQRWRALAERPAFVVARLSAVFGPWERSTGMRDTLSPPHRLTELVVAGQAIAPLPAGGERDWAYAPYVAQALRWLATDERALAHAVWNISPGRVWPLRMLADAFRGAGLAVHETAAGTPVRYNDDFRRRRAALDVSQLASAFRPPPEISVAASDFARWVLAHRAWYLAEQS